jgi:hypothetical protein
MTNISFDINGFPGQSNVPIIVMMLLTLYKTVLL